MRYGVCYLRHDCSDDTVFDEREQVDSKDLQLLKEHEGESERVRVRVTVRVRRALGNIT